MTKKEASKKNVIPERSFTRFLCFCAGVNFELLEECPTSENNRYVSIGTFVLLTASFAVLSSYLALSIFVEVIYMRILVSLLWGVTIFNLDRYFVSTMRKQDKGVKGGKWKELGGNFPRILFALAIAIVISKPLEMEIFSNEIDAKLPQVQKELFQGTEVSRQLEELEARNLALEDSLSAIDKPSDSTDEKNLFRNVLERQLISVDTDKVQYENQISALEDQKRISEDSKVRIQQRINRNAEQRDQFELEILNATGSDSINYARRIQTLQDAIDRDAAIRDGINREIADFQSQIANILLQMDESEQRLITAREDYVIDVQRKEGNKAQERARIKAEIADNKERIAKLRTEKEAKEKEFTGFAARLQAMNALTTGDSTTRWASWFIMLLLVLLELAPILGKVLSDKGVYDYALEAQKDSYLRQFQRNDEATEEEDKKLKDKKAALIRQRETLAIHLESVYLQALETKRAKDIEQNLDLVSKIGIPIVINHPDVPLNGKDPFDPKERKALLVSGPWMLQNTSPIYTYRFGRNYDFERINEETEYVDSGNWQFDEEKTDGLIVTLNMDGDEMKVKMTIKLITTVKLVLMAGSNNQTLQFYRGKQDDSNNPST